MKTLFTLLFCLFTFAFLFSCGNDSVTNNTNTPPPTPTFQDSIPKLLSPTAGTNFVIGDTLNLRWSRSYNYSFRLYIDTSSLFDSPNNFFVVSDTFKTFEPFTDSVSYTNYWKVEPLNHPEYTSDTSYFYINH